MSPDAAPALDVHFLILRDPRESIAKCSLTPLRGLPALRFLEYRPGRTVEVGERLLLDPEGEPLGPADRGRDVLLLDCAWRRVRALRATVRGVLHARRLPALATAYPRKSRLFHDPAQGLASAEALFAVSVLLGAPRPDFLAAYPWRAAFLAANPDLARELALAERSAT